MTKYVARYGCWLSDKDAQIVGERLEVISDGGPITPDDVVNDAAIPSSPLHGFFEWDDAEAAKAYRHDQARYLLRSIEIVREEQETTVRAWQAVREEDRQVFVPLQYAMRHVELWQQVLEDARGRLRAMAAQLRKYEELGTLADAIQMALITADQLA